MTRLTLVISSLGSGGAERVMTTMANYWSAKGWRVTLLSFDEGREPPFYDLHPGVERRPLGIASVSAGPARGVLKNLGRVVVLARALRATRPGAVISFMDTANVLVLLANLGLRLPVIVSERASPGDAPLNAGWRALRARLYPLASCLVAQTDAALAYFSPRVQRRARVIPNPVNPCVAAKAPGGGDSRQLIAVGRLSEEKGFDLLLRAFAGVAPRHPGWSLVVRGDGPLRTELEALRDELGLGGCVHLPGVTRSLHEQFRRSAGFVLSSRHEGFPNALCEAMSCGLPAVSFDCPCGPRQIVRHGVDGLLVPPGDVPALAAALDRLMGDPAERNRLAERAPDVAERFGLEKVMGMWEEAIACVV